jgi:hypothetical protein
VRNGEELPSSAVVLVHALDADPTAAAAVGRVPANALDRERLVHEVLASHEALREASWRLPDTDDRETSVVSTGPGPRRLPQTGHAAGSSRSCATCPGVVAAAGATGRRRPDLDRVRCSTDRR